MKTAVLCPGPSLATTFKGREPYECVAGVNRAVHRANCDVWVALDPSPFEAIPASWFTTETTLHNLRGLGRLPPGCQVTAVEPIFEQIPADLGGATWTAFSGVAALISMYLRGAKSIDVFGYDATDAPDFDGVNLHSNQRNKDRWEHEALCFKVVTKWLAARGCVVNRIKP